MKKIAKELLKIAKQMIAKQKGDSTDKWNKIKEAKEIIAYSDEDLAIELKEEIVDLIEKNKVTQQSINRLVEKYLKKEEYVDIDLVIDELDQFAKFNKKYDSDVNKVCKILEKL